MAKTVEISDDAYRRLDTVKQEGESFSNVIRRLTGAHMLRNFAGTMDKSTAREYRKRSHVAAEERTQNESNGSDAQIKMAVADGTSLHSNRTTCTGHSARSIRSAVTLPTW